jgi:hypothetical protein
LSAPYCVAGVVHRAGLGSDGMFLALPLANERQSNLDAIRGPPWDRFGSHMLLSFQRPPAPLERGLRSSDAPAALFAQADPGRTDEYSSLRKLRPVSGRCARVPVGRKPRQCSDLGPERRAR